MTTKSQSKPQVRCAIYTRKSTEEGLEQEFNSLDAQRESAEAYIKSQSHEGWIAVAEKYDDGGFTGGNMERPGLQRLMRDIEAGKIDCVVVYKVDRLSRSLLDFAQMMQVFDQHKIAFVSVTEQFNTASSMGRLVLNVLLSFAQFEREIISERTRDKIAATRRKGKWAGGWPILGYDVNANSLRLQVNPEEAERVRTIFELYLEHGSLLPVVEELHTCGWRNKQWQTRKGTSRGGHEFTRTSLYNLLTNPAYLGKTKHKDELHDGEHEAIITPAIWQRTQSQLARNGRTGGGGVRNQYGCILKGLLQCTACNCAMTPSHTKKGNKVYRYYVCSSATKRGWETCPAKSIPAHEIEQLLVRQIRVIGRDANIRSQVVQQARHQSEQRTQELDRERKACEKELRSLHVELQSLTGKMRPGEANEYLLTRLAEVQERIRTSEVRNATIRDELDTLARSTITDADAMAALTQFDPVWESLNPREQERVLKLLITQVNFDGSRGKVAIQFRPTGIRTLAQEATQPKEK